MHLPLRSLMLLAALAASAALAGCHVDEHKNGKNDNVSIDVPFGSMHIKTNNDADTAGIGLTPYPGAVPVKDDNDKDSDAADINMSFGGFHLGIKAATFQTADSPDKVEAFYRKDMAHFGDVIKCRGHETIGQPAQTSQGLTCDDDDHGGKKVHANVNHNETPELRARFPAAPAHCGPGAEGRRDEDRAGDARPATRQRFQG